VDKEAQAREQFFRLEEEVQNALAGRVQDRIRTTTFRGTGGIHAAERRLRLLLGVPINDRRLIRPTGEPLVAKVVFNWHEVLPEALTRRAELRRQKWQIQRDELRVLASRNFLLPRVDAVGRYRFRGLGHDLINPTRQGMFDNAFQDLTSGDYQEWQLGLEVSVPIGYRKAHSAIRHAELSLARDRAILEQQEKDIVHDLIAAIAEIDRAYLTSQTNYNRRLAAQDQLNVLESNYVGADQRDKTRLLDRLMDAQRRLTDAEAKYYRSLIEYTLAVKNVHFQKGSLLVYNQVYLSEGPWPGAAYSDAMERDSNRYDPIPIINYIFSRPWPVSRGEFPQRVVPLDAADQIEELPRPEGTNPESAATSPESHPAQEVRANERVRMANRGGPAIRPRVRRVPGTSLARRSHYATRGAPARFNATPQPPGIVIDRSETTPRI
jgi:hypothetical protein